MEDPKRSEFEIEEEVHFVQKRPHRQNRNPRPLSLASQIISNPKLVKSLGDLSEAERLTRYVSHIKIDDSHPPDVDLGNGWHRYLGILLTLLASLVFSLGSIIVKSISEQYHPFSITVWTFQGILIPSLIVLIFQKVCRKEDVFKGVWPLKAKQKLKNSSLLLIRALFGAGGTVLKVYSLKYMDVADSTIIAFSSPVFVVIIAWIFLREKCGVIPIFTAILVLVGVGVISRPPLLTGKAEFDTDLLTGCSMAFSCMLLGTFVVVILRYVRDVHYALITFIYGLVGTILSLALCFAISSFQLPNCPKHWLFAVGVAGLTFVGQNTLTLAFKYEQAGPIALIRTSEIPFTFGWQLLLLHTVPDLLSLVGALIVVFGVFIITIRKWISTLPEDHSVRKSCCSLLLL